MTFFFMGTNALSEIVMHIPVELAVLIGIVGTIGMNAFATYVSLRAQMND